MELVINHQKPSVQELIQVLRKDFSERYNYSTFGSNNTIYIMHFLIPMGQITLEENQIKVEQPKRLAAFFSSLVRVMTGYADRMKPHLDNLQTSLSQFLNKQYS